MPLFPDERPSTHAEVVDPDFRTNALETFTEQTGLTIESVIFSTVRTPANGGYEYMVARPYTVDPRLGGRRPRLGDPDRWWVFDWDVDEDAGWVAQATFTPEGFIDYGEGNPPPFGGGPADDGGDPGGLFPDGPLATHSGEPYDHTPRDPNAPVTATIDLDEHEAAEREGIPAWEEHGNHSVLVTTSGFAVVNMASGLVRYPDKTGISFQAGSTAEARNQCEKYLAKRPYTTAFERVLGEPDYDAPEPALEKVPTAAPSVPRPKPEKRVWNTVSMASAEDDD